MVRIPNEAAARKMFECMRWPNGVACAHCERVKVYRLVPKARSKSPGRKGLWKCGDCRKQFTVTVGTIFEGSHINLRKWVDAIYIMCSSKKGFSALQLQRMLDLRTYKSAWLMCHRIRHAMSQGPMVNILSGVGEANDTFISWEERNPGNEKPISLYPLTPEEALAGLMQVRRAGDRQVRKFRIADRVQDAHGRVGTVANIPEYNLYVRLPEGNTGIEAMYLIKWDDFEVMVLVRESDLRPAPV